VDGVTIREAVISATGTALAIGQKNAAPIRNVRVESLDVADAPRGISIIQMNDEAISGLSFRDVTMHLHTAPGDVGGGIPLQIASAASGSDKAIRDVLIEGLEANAYRSSVFQARSTAPIRDLRLWNLKIRAEAGRQAVGDSEPQPILRFNGVQGARLGSLAITWPAQKSELWSVPVDSELTDKIDFSPQEVRQTTRPAGD
jgi:hypothetical protein